MATPRKSKENPKPRAKPKKKPAKAKTTRKKADPASGGEETISNVFRDTL
ncbi:MAG: hypothetical protein HY558_00195 [Euryarchaeota archaeon]|nr:hypothetical protein [Euryarchaeota archaeon]